jgi:amidase
MPQSASLVVALAILLGSTVGGDVRLTPRAPNAQSADTRRKPRPRFDVTEKSIAELSRALREGRVSSRELTEAYLARIAAFDQTGPALNAMIALNPRALADADALDRERAARGPRGPLHGIPLVVKDNFDTIDLPTTAGSIALKGSMPGRDAFQVRKLREAGAVIVGKTNLHEFARGITTVSSLGGQTRNPYDPTRNPGGSSGGTGAAVAASFAAAGLGSDTCGSIRYPAAENNLVGLRPTLGLTSRSGIIPLAHSQDVGGPLARTVRDVAVLLDATTGSDPDDPVTTRPERRVAASYAGGLAAAALRGARLGVLTPYFGTTPEEARVSAIVRDAIRDMTAAGATAIDIADAELPTETEDVAIIRYEFKFDLDDYLRRTPAAPVRTLAEVLEKGAFHPSLEQAFRRSNEVASLDSDEYRAIVARNAQLRAALLERMENARLTALVYPTLRRTPARIGEPQAGGNCAAAAATGLPAITVPAGFVDGLPIGVELLGRPYSELELLRLALAYESATHHRRPPALTPALTTAGR